MKKVLSYGTGLFAFALVILTGFASYRLVQAQNSGSGTGSCPSTLTTNIAQNANLSGVVMLNVGVPTTTATNFTINRVVYVLDTKIIGEAKSNTTIGNSWSMPWLTSFSSPGSHQLSARVTYNQTQVCQTPTRSVNLLNTAVSPAVMSLDVAPALWRGLTNTSLDFNAVASVNSTEITPPYLQQYAYYEWTTSIGSVAPARSTARFNSGPSSGKGRIMVKALYGGKEVVREIPIEVESQTSTDTSSGSSSSDSTESSTNTGTNSGPSAPTTTDTARTTSQIDSQPEVLSCTNLNLSPERIQLLKTQAQRLGSEEFRAIRGCFSQLNYVVPSAYAPIAPEKIKTAEISESSDARISDATTGNRTVGESGTALTTLRFQGKAKPDSDVLLYLFSEPLVLYAKADSDGNWVYELVDPLEPGNHEAYAVVEEADGTYKKSSVFSFLIETAVASAENPNGYSLSVQTVASLSPPASKQRMNLYIIGAGVIVLLVMVMGTVLLRRTLKHVPSDSENKDSNLGE